MRVNGFEPDVFRQLMEFAHTGRVDLMPRTIIGVICAADHYSFNGEKLALILHEQLTKVFLSIDLRDGGMQFFPMCLKVKKLFLIVIVIGEYFL